MPIGRTVIHVKGLDRVALNVSRLPISIARESKKFRRAYAADWQRQLKLRAPVGVTGKLKESIKVMPGKKDNEIIVEINSPYGFPQAFGFAAHLVHKSMSWPGTATMGQWAAKKGLPDTDFYWVKKPSYGHGFYNRTELLMFKRLHWYGVAAVKQAIKDAGFKGG